MRPFSRARLSPSALLLLGLISIGGISRVSAQGDLPTLSASTDNALPTASSPTDSATSAEESSAAQSSGSDSATSSGSGVPNLSTASGSASETSTSTSATDGGPPALSTADAGGGVISLTGLPTLSGAYNYPPPTVPPTAAAPFMQKSDLPQDSVFIAVGAVLGFFALLIIAWRVLVAWSINRSVRKSGQAAYAPVPETKSANRKSGLYNAPIGSAMSLEKLDSNRAGSAPKPITPSGSLFFSPTAGAGMHSGGNRNSGYLPAGYYASGTAAPGGPTGMTTIGGTGTAKLRPQSGQYVTTRSVIESSPEGSPELRPSTGVASFRDSRSSLNLNAASGNKTPSTYLDDLMNNNVPPVPQHRNSYQNPPTSSGAGSAPSRESRRYSNRG